MKIPITKPSITKKELDIILNPLKKGWLVQGSYVSEFEKLFKKYTGSKFAVATTSCTTALHLGLIALEIRKGDKVIVPSFTFVASANAVEYTGATVVFCDINIRTFNIDETKLEELIEKEPEIKAIMPVNLFGLCANLPKIVTIAKKYNLKVIEDSACGFESYIENKHSGTFGNVGCFSFHPRKIITTGEGGMLITNSEKIANKIRILRDHGASKSDFQRHQMNGSLLPEYNELGFNYRMTDLQGALGVAQIQRAKELIEKRRKIAEKYYQNLGNIEDLLLPYIPCDYTHSFQSFVVLFTKGEEIEKLTKNKIEKLNIERNKFMRRLEEKGISTRQGTHAVHTLGYYKKKYNLQEEKFLMSYIADRLSIALPLYDMKEDECEYVVENIIKLIKK